LFVLSSPKTRPRKKPTATQSARGLLVIIKRFFNWVIGQHIYGLSTRRAAG
jgi:hypothetical protein